MNEEALKKYLSENEIFIIGEYFKKNNSKINPSSQIDVIIKLQEVLSRYHSIEKNSILSEIGKRIDRISVINKKLNNIVDRNDFYQRLIIDKTNFELSKLDNIDIVSIYKRGMEKEEMCIDRVDESNLRVTEKIELGQVKRISFNIVEDDFINYLLRLKKKIGKKDLLNYSEEYVSKNKLDKNSLKYINSMVRIPNESIKYWYKNRFDFGCNKEKLRAIVEKEINF